MRRPAPLPSSFMLISILGFLISVFFIAPSFSMTWGFAFSLVFLMMFIASVISMSRISADSRLDMEVLAVHEEISKGKQKKRRKK